MRKIIGLFAAASVALFFASAALAQGTATNHAFVIGKGPGVTGYTSLLCGSAQLAVGQSAADPICRTITGDVTVTAAGVTAIGSAKVLGSMLGAMSSAQLLAALSDETGTGAAVFAGSPTLTGTLTGAAANFSGTITFGTGTITGLTAKASPDSANDYAIIYDSAGTAVKKATVGSIGSAGSVSSVGLLTGAVGVANGIEASGSNIQITAARRTLPTTSSVTTGAHTGGFSANGTGTYTTPANVLSIRVTIVGGGGGGGGGGSSSTGGSVGGDSCWKASATPCTTPLHQAGGGGLGGNGTFGAGGTVSGSGTCDVISNTGGMGNQQGSQSISGTATGAGGSGGASFFGGGGAGGFGGGGSNAVSLGSGGGGGSANTSASSNSGGGGGAGAICQVRINSPGATYTYTVGAAGTAANSGGAGNNGGNGAAGYIVVEEFYN